MKFLYGLILVVAVASAYPADREPLTPSTTTTTAKSFDVVDVETDVVDQFPPIRRIPFDDGFFGGFNDLFERMRQQLYYLLSTVPRVGFGTPEGGNTTSVTKVIDGHKVVINETVYSTGDGEDAAAVFKVRVIDIRPENDDSDDIGTTDTKTPNPNRSVESVEHSLENEIPKSGQQKRKADDPQNAEMSDNLETFDELDNNKLETFDEPNENNAKLETFDDEPIDEYLESFGNSVETELGAGVDLHHDIYVNKLATERDVTPNADAEIIFSNPAQYSRPYDLSSDINVNNIAEMQGWPKNPDAELIEPVARYEQIKPALVEDTYVNELAFVRGQETNPEAEVIIGAQPDSKYYYKTENS